MAKTIRVKKGLSINLKGKAPLENLPALQKSSVYGLVPDDYQGVVPKVLVKEGDAVKAGDPLFCHKKYPEMLFTSPISGTVVAVRRGEKRKLLSVDIAPAADVEYREYPLFSPSQGREALLKHLLSSGMWAFFKQRPYDIIANPEEAPRDIFVTALFTAPLAPDVTYLLKDRENDLSVALEALAMLTEGTVYVSCQKGSALTRLSSIKGIEVIEVEGPHPAGCVGTQINHIRPVNKGEVVWTLKVTDLLVMGRFLRTGKVDYTRTIAVTGSDATLHGYVSMLPGCHVEEAFARNLTLKKEHERVINGDVLTGIQLSKERPFASLNIDQITVIPEGDDVDEMFGWIMPRFNQFSISRLYMSWLQKGKEYTLDARLKGGERAMIMSNEFHRVFPLDIYPEQLLKAIIAFDIDKMEALGIYEVAPEDFALCEFVDSSKQELQYIVRKGLDLLYKEMN